MAGRNNYHALQEPGRNGTDGAYYLGLLHELGLSHLEAVVYTALVGMGPSPAKDVSEASNLAREHCYETLRKLEAKGLVNVELSDRSVFVPLEPRTAVSFLLTRAEAHYNKLRDSANEVGAWLDTIANSLPKSREDHPHPAAPIQLLFGKRAYLEFEREIDRCERDYMGVFSPRTLAAPRGLWTLEALSRAARRGVRVRVLTGVLPDYGNGLERLTKELKIRKNVVAGNGLRFDVFDQSRAFQPMHLPTAAEEQSEVIYTANPAIVGGLVTYFEHLWRSSASASRPS